MKNILEFESVTLFKQKCPLHTNEQMNLICLQSECLQNGFLCKQCQKQHQQHKVLNGPEFLEMLRKLVNYDGQYKVPESIDGLAAKTQSSLIAIVDEMEQQTEFFKSQLALFRYQFDKYKIVSSDVASISNLIHYIYQIDSQQDCFREQLQSVLPKLIIQDGELLVNSITQCQNEALFLPDESLIQDYLERYLHKFQNMYRVLQNELNKPQHYNKLDLKRKTFESNKQAEPIVFEKETDKIEDQVVEKFIIDRPDANNLLQSSKKNKIKPRIKQEPILEDIRDGCERVEKVQVIAGHRVWYLDLIYPKFKAKNWVIEPRNACLICKCHPKFARIKEFLHVKYGDLYGPCPCDGPLHLNFRAAVSSRKDKQYLVERIGLYFHDLCIYWSTGIEVDEKRGVIDFDTFHYAVRQALETFCYLCKRRGATLKCNAPECEVWVHYYCWKELEQSQQFLDTTKFRMLCHRHVPENYTKPAWVYQNSFIEKDETDRIPQGVKILNENSEIQ